MKLPNLYPISGSNPYTQPASRNISPVVTPVGGIPVVMAGKGQRQFLQATGVYNINASASGQLIIGGNPSSGNPPLVNFNTILPKDEPYELVSIHSSYLFNVGSFQLELNSLLVAMEFTQSIGGSNKYLCFGPPPGTVTFLNFAFSWQIPTLRYDDCISQDPLGLWDGSISFNASISNPTSTATTLSVTLNYLYEVRMLTA